MLSKLRNRQGFTLIELLIVVAIIGILAAVAIPQLTAYRMRGFNSAANSDIKNAKTTQEALFSDFQTYGKSQGSTAAPVLLTAATVAAAGTVITGPVAAATGTVAGGLISGPDTSGVACGMGVGVSNNVGLVSLVAAVPAGATGFPSYMMFAKHLQGNREFGTEAENTAIFVVTNETTGAATSFINNPLTAAGGPAAAPAAATTGQEFSTTPGALTAGGGSPNPSWVPM